MNIVTISEQHRWIVGYGRWLALAVLVIVLVGWSGAAYAAETGPGAQTTPAEHSKPEPGVLVVRVAADSPAAQAGVERGDILLAIDGDAVNTAPELVHVILMHEPGDKIELTVKHGDEERTLSVTLGDRNGRPWLGVVPYEGGQKGRSSRSGRFGAGGQQGRGFGVGPHGLGFRFSGKEGARVAEVVPDGPAAQAGLQAGDVITAVGEAQVANLDTLVEALSAYKPGDAVALTVDRNGASMSVEVTLGEHPDDAQRAFLGVQIRPDFGFGPGRQPPFRFGPGEFTRGAVIEAVDEGSPAQEAGLQEGDVVTQINGEPVESPRALVQAVRGAAPGDELTLTVMRGDGEVEVTVTLAEGDNGEAFMGVRIAPSFRIGPGDRNFRFGPFGGEGDFRRGPGQERFFGTPGGRSPEIPFWFFVRPHQGGFDRPHEFFFGAPPSEFQGGPQPAPGVRENAPTPGQTI